MARAITLERGVPRFSMRPRVGAIAKHAVLIVVAVVVAYPFYFMITSSLKDVLEAARTPPTIFPTELHPENYGDAWNRAPWGRYFVNTIFVSVTVTVLELITACHDACNRLGIDSGPPSMPEESDKRNVSRSGLSKCSGFRRTGINRRHRQVLGDVTE